MSPSAICLAPLSDNRVDGFDDDSIPPCETDIACGACCIRYGDESITTIDWMPVVIGLALGCSGMNRMDRAIISSGQLLEPIEMEEILNVEEVPTLTTSPGESPSPDRDGESYGDVLTNPPGIPWFDSDESSALQTADETVEYRDERAAADGERLTALDHVE